MRERQLDYLLRSCTRSTRFVPSLGCCECHLSFGPQPILGVPGLALSEFADLVVEILIKVAYNKLHLSRKPRFASLINLYLLYYSNFPKPTTSCHHPFVGLTTLGSDSLNSSPEPITPPTHFITRKDAYILHIAGIATFRRGFGTFALISRQQRGRKPHFRACKFAHKTCEPSLLFRSH